jgi:thioredoxin 1
MEENENDELERILKLKDLIDIQQCNGAFDNGTNWPDASIIVNDTSFSHIIKKYPMVVIDCWAHWCGPCHMVAPIIEDLAKDFTGKIVFGKLDTDLNKMSADRYNIMSIPTFLVFKKGKLVDRFMGMMTRETIEPLITKHLSREKTL